MSDTAEFLNQNINRLMLDKLEWIKERMRERLPSEPGSFTPAEGMIFSTLRGRTLTLSEIARHRGVSRQAIHRTVSGLVDRGLLRIDPAENSKRDKVVVITEAGQKKRDDVATVLRQIENEIAAAMGRDRLEQLRELLSRDWSGEIPEK